LVHKEKEKKLRETYLIRLGEFYHLDKSYKRRYMFICVQIRGNPALLALDSLERALHAVKKLNIVILYGVLECMSGVS
jgi:hypothetical protein